MSVLLTKKFFILDATNFVKWNKDIDNGFVPGAIVTPGASSRSTNPWTKHVSGLLMYFCISTRLIELLDHVSFWKRETCKDLWVSQRQHSKLSRQPQSHTGKRKRVRGSRLRLWWLPTPSSDLRTVVHSYVCWQTASIFGSTMIWNLQLVLLENYVCYARFLKSF